MSDGDFKFEKQKSQTFSKNPTVNKNWNIGKTCFFIVLPSNTISSQHFQDWLFAQTQALWETWNDLWPKQDFSRPYTILACQKYIQVRQTIEPRKVSWKFFWKTCVCNNVGIYCCKIYHQSVLTRGCCDTSYNLLLQVMAINKITHKMCVNY